MKKEDVPKQIKGADKSIKDAAKQIKD